MDTLIELYDTNNVGNLLGGYVFKPKQVVLLLDEKNTTKRKKEIIKKYEQHLKKVKFIYEDIDLHDVASSKNKMSNILDKYPGAVIDLTGGHNLLVYLVAKLGNKPAIILNEETSCFENVNGNFLNKPVPVNLSLAEQLEMSGRKLIFDGYKIGNGSINDYFDDIEAMWKITTKNYRIWNNRMIWFQAMNSDTYKNLQKGTTITLPFTIGKVSCDYQILNDLSEYGIIQSFTRKGDNQISIKFKNAFVRNNITNVGVWLEYYLYMVAIKSKKFDEVHISSKIDLDGVKKVQNATNELDIILTKGIRSAFVSCKTCEITTNMINEIVMLRDNVGHYFTTAAIATTQKICDITPAIKERAEEMKVKVITQEKIDSLGISDILLSLVEP